MDGEKKGPIIFMKLTHNSLVLIFRKEDPLQVFQQRTWVPVSRTTRRHSFCPNAGSLAGNSAVQRHSCSRRLW